jgi:hypothetical protein
MQINPGARRLLRRHPQEEVTLETLFPSDILDSGDVSAHSFALGTDNNLDFSRADRHLCDRHDRDRSAKDDHVRWRSHRNVRARPRTAGNDLRDHDARDWNRRDYDLHAGSC